MLCLLFALPVPAIVEVDPSTHPNPNKDAGETSPFSISTLRSNGSIYIVLTIWSNWYCVFRIVNVIVPTFNSLDHYDYTLRF